MNIKRMDKFLLILNISFANKNIFFQVVGYRFLERDGTVHKLFLPLDISMYFTFVTLKVLFISTKTTDTNYYYLIEQIVS